MPVVTSVISGSNDSLILSGGVNEGIQLTGSVFFKNAAKFGGGYGDNGVTISAAGAISADGNLTAGNITVAGNIAGDGDESKTIFAETATSSNTITLGGGGKVVASGDLQITHTGSFGALQVGTDYDGTSVPDAGYPFRVSNDADDVGIVIDAGNNKVASLLFSERSLETAAPGWFVDHSADQKNRASWRTSNQEQGQGAIVIHNDLKSVRIGGGDLAGDGYDAESLIITSSDYRDPSMIRLRTKHGSRSKEAYPVISWMMETATGTNSGHWVMGIDPYSDGDGDSAGEYLKINASSPASSTGMSNTTAMTFRKGGDDSAVGVGGATTSRSLIPTGTLHVENQKPGAYTITKDLTSAQLFVGNSYNSTNAASAGIYLDVSSESDTTKHSAHLLAVSNGVAAEHTAYFSLGLHDGSGNANSTRSRFRVDDQGGALFISGTNPGAGAGWPKPEASNHEVNVEVPSGSLTLLSNVNMASQPTLNFVSWPSNAYAGRTIAPGQEMGRISWWSSDTDLSEGERVGAFIEAVATDNHTAVNKSPMKLDFYTRAEGGATPGIRISIAEDGTVDMTGDATVGGDLTIEGNDIKGSSGTAITFSGVETQLAGDLKVGGNEIKDSGGAAAVTFDGSQNTTLGGNLTGSNVLLSGDIDMGGGGILFQQASSNLTIDVTNSIVLDSDSGYVWIKDDGASHFKFDCNNTAFTIYDDTFSADYLSFQVAADGASTISTGDNGGGISGHLTLAPDGELYLESKGTLSASADDDMTFMVNADATSTIENQFTFSAFYGATETDMARLTGNTADGGRMGDLWLKGDLTIGGDDIKDSGSNTAISFDGSGNIDQTTKFSHAYPIQIATADGTITDAASTQVLKFPGAGAGGMVLVSGDFTADGGVKVDNITIDGQEIDVSSGNLTIDVAGDIELNAGGGDITFKKASSTLGSFDTSGNLNIAGALQTTAIAYTDGDSAITVADGGYIKHTAGIQTAAGIMVSDDASSSAGEWCKIAMGGIASATTVGTLIVTIGGSSVANYVKSTTFIIHAKAADNSATNMILTAEPVSRNIDGRTVNDPLWDPSSHLAITWTNDSQEIWVKAAANNTGCWVTAIEGPAASVSFEQNPWVIPVGADQEGWVGSIDNLGTITYGQWADKVFNSVILRDDAATLWMSGSSDYRVGVNSSDSNLEIGYGHTTGTDVLIGVHGSDKMVEIPHGMDFLAPIIPAAGATPQVNRWLPIAQNITVTSNEDTSTAVFLVEMTNRPYSTAWGAEQTLMIRVRYTGLTGSPYYDADGTSVVVEALHSENLGDFELDKTSNSHAALSVDSSRNGTLYLKAALAYTHIYVTHLGGGMGSEQGSDNYQDAGFKILQNQSWTAALPGAEFQVYGEWAQKLFQKIDAVETGGLIIGYSAYDPNVAESFTTSASAWSSTGPYVVDGSSNKKQIAFNAPASGKVEITAKVWVNQDTTISAAYFLEMALTANNSSWSSVTGTEKIAFLASEHASVGTQGLVNISWAITGLTPGTLYTYYLGAAETNSSQEHVLSWGGDYPALIIQAVSLPTTIQS